MSSVETIDHITKAEIDTFLSQPVENEDVTQAYRNLSELPMARAGEVVGEIAEVIGDQTIQTGKKVVATTLITAAGYGLIGKLPGSESDDAESSLASSAPIEQVIADSPTSALVASPEQVLANAIGSTASPDDKPASKQDFLDTLKTDLAKDVVNGDEEATIVAKPESIPLDLLATEAAVVSELDAGESQELTAATHELNPDPVETVVKTKAEDGTVLESAVSAVVLPVDTEIANKAMEKAKADIFAFAVAANEAANKALETPGENSLELAWIKETTVQGLATHILNNPKIKIAPSAGDQVLKSIQMAAETGKTFSYNLGNVNNPETVISPKLMQLVLYLTNIKGHNLTIGSFTTGNHGPTSLHWPGLATDLYPEIADNRNGDVDFNSPEVIAAFQELYADMYTVREMFGIDELIYKFPTPGTTLLKHGQDASNGVYGQTVMNNHLDHGHVDVNGHDAVDPEVIYNLVFALSPEKIALIDSLQIEQWKKDNLKNILPLIMRYSSTSDTVTTAQWWVESNAGHDCPGNNCSGMKPDGYWKGETQTFQTFEYRNGVRKVETHAFKKYGSLQEWIQDHDALINRAPHYKDAIAAKDDWRAYLHGLINPGEPAYATAPNYEAVLTDIIENNHLEELTK